MATTTSKVQYDGVVNATVKYNNSNDTDRVYDISAEVSVSGSTITGFNTGQASRRVNPGPSASFNSWGENDMSVSMSGVPDKAEKIALFTAIADFIDDVRAQVEASPVSEI